MLNWSLFEGLLSISLTNGLSFNELTLHCLNHVTPNTFLQPLGLVPAELRLEQLF